MAWSEPGPEGCTWAETETGSMAINTAESGVVRTRNLPGRTLWESSGQMALFQPRRLLAHHKAVLAEVQS
jgi:hypothetical protein